MPYLVFKEIGENEYISQSSVAMYKDIYLAAPKRLSE